MGPTWGAVPGFFPQGLGVFGASPIWDTALAVLRLSARWPGTIGYPVAAPPDPLSVFSSYRSDGGHAVTQITFPNDVVATVAVPARPALAAVLDFWRIG